MKASAIAAVLGVALAGTAQAAPTVYGKVNVSYQVEDSDTDDTSTWQLRSNASRVGVKGELGAGELKGFYKVEFEVDVADGNGGIDKGRNQIAGLKGDFGKVFFGRHDTPTKVLGKVFDRFNDQTLGDIKKTLLGEERIEDSISYVSPNMDGLQAWVMVAPGEETVAGSGANANDGPADAISASVKYSVDGLTLGLAVDSEVDGADVIRLVGGYKTADFGVSAIFQTAEDSATGNTEFTSFGLSGQFNIDSANVVKAQFTTTNIEVGAADADTSMFSIGYDHKLDKKSKVYAFYTSADDEDLAPTLENPSTFGIGLEHKF